MSGAVYYLYVLIESVFIPYLGYRIVKVIHQKFAGKKISPMLEIPILIVTCVLLSIGVDRIYDWHSGGSGSELYAPRVGFILGFALSIAASLRHLSKKT